MLSKPVKTLNHSKANPIKRISRHGNIKGSKLQDSEYDEIALEDFSKEGIDGGELNADAQQ